MEEIRKLVDEMMVWAGVSGDSVPVLRHLLLTVTAILLAIISDFLCRKILVPLISKITEKTEISWDDVLFNKKVLNSACHIVPAVVIWSLMPLIYLEYPIFKEILERATGIYIVVMSVRTVLVSSALSKDWKMPRIAGPLLNSIFILSVACSGFSCSL